MKFHQIAHQIFRRIRKIHHALIRTSPDDVNPWVNRQNMLHLNILFSDGEHPTPHQFSINRLFVDFNQCHFQNENIVIIARNQCIIRRISSQYNGFAHPELVDFWRNGIFILCQQGNGTRIATRDNRLFDIVIRFEAMKNRCHHCHIARIRLQTGKTIVIGSKPSQSQRRMLMNIGGNGDHLFFVCVIDAVPQIAQVNHQ